MSKNVSRDSVASHCYAAREPRTIFIGATQNGNAKVGGWLPFVVDESPIYRAMRVYGTLYTDYRSSTFESKESAISKARRKATDGYASDGDTIKEIEGCHRCWNDNDPRHIENVDGVVRCATCHRQLKSA